MSLKKRKHKSFADQKKRSYRRFAGSLSRGFKSRRRRWIFPVILCVADTLLEHRDVEQENVEQEKAAEQNRMIVVLLLQRTMEQVDEREHDFDKPTHHTLLQGEEEKDFIEKIQNMTSKEREEALKHPGVGDVLNHVFILPSVLLFLMIGFFCKSSSSLDSPLDQHTVSSRMVG